jgi:hypothetical protein
MYGNDLTLLRMKPIFNGLAVERYRQGVVCPVGDSR